MREFKVDANVGRPQVAYRETIKKRVEKIEGKFIRQSGGKGQYGHVVINMEPAEPGQGFVFEDKIVGGVIPREYIGPTEAGIKEALDTGVLAGYPMVDVKVQLVYGSYHDVDSSEMAFKIAGSMAFKEAARARESVSARAGDEGRGRVPGSVHGRRPRRPVLASRQDRRHDAARRGAGDLGDVCRFPRCSVTRPSCAVMSQGRAVYSMEFAHYEEVPKSKAEEIISKVKA